MDDVKQLKFFQMVPNHLNKKNKQNNYNKINWYYIFKIPPNVKTCMKSCQMLTYI